MSTTRAGRRMRYGVLSAVLVGAALVSTVLINVLAGKFPRRFDVTATGEHRLSPRSASIVRNLPGESQVVVMGALGSIDAHAKDDVRDVLRTFAQDSGGKFTWRMIDVATPRGQDDAAALLAELVKHDQAEAQAQRGKVEAIVKSLDKAALDAETSLSPGIQRLLKQDLTTSADPRAKDAFANVFRAGDEIARWPAQWKSLGERALAELSRKESGLDTPAPGQAARLVADDLSGRVLVLVSLESQLRVLAGLVNDSKDFLEQFAGAVRARREFIDSISESAAGVRTLDSEAALRRLRLSGTVLVLAPGRAEGGVRSIELTDLFSPPGGRDAPASTRASVRQHAESVIARELAAVVVEHPPIVVLMTAEAAVSGRRLRMFDGTRALLRERGMDVIEWDVAETPQRPDLSAADPRSQRPVVWVARFPDNSRASGESGERSGLDRARVLGEETAKLAAEGRNLLISVGPSIVPVDKEPDPADGVLARFGLSVRSDRVVMDQTFVGNRQVVRADLLAKAAAEDKPIVGAVRGLPLLMPWPVPIVRKDPAAPSWTVEEISAGSAWLESEWRAFKSVPRDRREQVSDPPTFTAGKDERTGPWTVVAAAEKPGAGAAGSVQRLVAVGSNDWLSFAEAVWSAQRQGRAGAGDIAAAQANAELLESAVQWLAGHDELVAQGVESRATPLIKPIAESRLLWLKILLMAGLPVLVLVVGLLSRVVMG